jgi:hypothetical protein
MSPDKVQSRTGGFLVFAVPGSGQVEAVPQLGLRHYETEDKAIEAAKRFAAQAADYQAFVVPATGYSYRVSESKSKSKFG